MPWSIVSGVRSSCEAVATNARRANPAAQLLLDSAERPREVATSSLRSSRGIETAGLG